MIIKGLNVKLIPLPRIKCLFSKVLKRQYPFLIGDKTYVNKMTRVRAFSLYAMEVETIYRNIFMQTDIKNHWLLKHRLNKQEVLERNNSILSFDKTRTLIENYSLIILLLLLV
jgi:hypothetical protein